MTLQKVFLDLDPPGPESRVAPTCTQNEKYPSVVAIKTIRDVTTG